MDAKGILLSKAEIRQKVDEDFVNFFLEHLKEEDWISVEKELPSIDESEEWNKTHKISPRLLTYSKDWGIRLGQYFGLAEIWNVDGVSSSNGIKVTHFKYENPPTECILLSEKSLERDWQKEEDEHWEKFKKEEESEETWNRACKQILEDISVVFLNKSNQDKADLNSDKYVFQALGESITTFPIPEYKPLTHPTK